MPPSWLHPEALSLILEIESQHADYKNAFSPPPPLPGQPSILDQGREPTARPQYTPDGNRYYAAPPFLPHNTAQATMSSRDPPALPFHWVEVGNMLLDTASDDLVDPDQVRRLLKDLREVRMAKMRSGFDAMDAAATGGGGVGLTGVGAMEVGEERGFLSGFVDGLRYVATDEYCRFMLHLLGMGHCIADWHSAGKSALRKNKRGENRWPSKEPTAAMMKVKMKMKTTWSSSAWDGLLIFRRFRCICETMSSRTLLMFIDVYTRIS